MTSKNFQDSLFNIKLILKSSYWDNNFKKKKKKKGSKSYGTSSETLYRYQFKHS